MLASGRAGCGFGSKEFAETERRLAADLLWPVEKSRQKQMTKIVFAVIVCGVSYERLTAEEKVGYDAMRSRMSPRFVHNAQKSLRPCHCGGIFFVDLKNGVMFEENCSK